MRGKVIDDYMVTILERITPAYAGKSSPFSFFAHTYWDHPRVCGEKKELFMILRNVKGSPPRMRGKGSPDGPFCSRSGITPAYAGKRKVWEGKPNE